MLNLDLNLKDHPGLPLIIIGMLVIIFAVRRSRARLRDQQRQDINEKDKKPWV